MSKMRIFIISIGIFLLIDILNATPSVTSIESDESSSSEEENGVVYIFNVYAVKNTNLQAVANMLSQASIDKLPPVFDHFGSIIFSDKNADMPKTLEELAEMSEDTETPLNKIDTEQESNVYELKLNQPSFEDSQIMSFDEFFDLIEDEDLILYMNDSGKKIEVTFEEELKNPQDQVLTVKEFFDYVENKGYLINKVKLQIESIAVGFSIEFSEAKDTEKPEDDREPSTTQRIDDEKTNIENKEDAINEIENREGNKIDKNFEDKIEKNSLGEKKKEKNAKNNDWFVTLDYVTKADSTNKIRRRRRSACQHCKFDNLIREFAFKSEKHY